MMDMKQIKKQKILEQVIYWVIWLLIFLAPLFGAVMIGKESNNVPINWRIMARSWLKILPFFIVFLAHNYILLPYLLRKRYGLYITWVIVLIAGLTFCNVYPPFRFMQKMDEKEMRQKPQDIPHRPDMQSNHQPGDDMRNNGDGPDIINSPMLTGGDEKPPQMDNNPKGPQQMNPGGPTNPQVKAFPDKKPDYFMHQRGPNPFLDNLFFSFIYFIIAVLMVGFNIAIKLFFQSLKNEEKMKEMEKERLSSELQYLKYQLNPHFFMNTLNNIHALVDIDTDKAKSSIIELSKLMRYVLYEATNATISLSKEIQFLENYITLMKLRFTNKVRIDVDIPSTLPDVQIPPLLFICFLENAFKHGISYQKESFIQMKVQADSTNNKFIFYCANSNCGRDEEIHHGIGLENVKKRLSLLYGDNYTLTIHDNKEKNIFEVLLIIPLQL
jgi:two-component sensor histidine kinase